MVKVENVPITSVMTTVWETTEMLVSYHPYSTLPQARHCFTHFRDAVLDSVRLSRSAVQRIGTASRFSDCRSFQIRGRSSGMCPRSVPASACPSTSYRASRYVDVAFSSSSERWSAPALQSAHQGRLLFSDFARIRGCHQNDLPSASGTASTIRLALEPPFKMVFPFKKKL